MFYKWDGKSTRIEVGRAVTLETKGSIFCKKWPISFIIILELLILILFHNKIGVNLNKHPYKEIYPDYLKYPKINLTKVLSGMAPLISTWPQTGISTRDFHHLKDSWDKGFSSLT